jgi:hypothetical protein
VRNVEFWQEVQAFIEGSFEQDSKENAKTCQIHLLERDTLSTGLGTGMNWPASKAAFTYETQE